MIVSLVLHAVSYRSFDYLKFIDTRIVRKNSRFFFFKKTNTFIMILSWLNT